MRKLKNRRIPNGTYGGVRGRRAEARLLLDSKKSLGLQKNIKTSKKGLTNPRKFEALPVSKGTTPIVNKEDLL